MSPRARWSDYNFADSKYTDCDQSDIAESTAGSAGQTLGQHSASTELDLIADQLACQTPAELAKYLRELSVLAKGQTGNSTKEEQHHLNRISAALEGISQKIGGDSSV